MAALAATLPASAAWAAPVIVLNARPSVEPAPVTRCAPLATSAGGSDIECVVTLAAPAQGEPARGPSRIVIRTEMGQARCVSTGAQVVRLSGLQTRPRRLPFVEHAGVSRPCAS